MLAGKETRGQRLNLCNPIFYFSQTLAKFLNYVKGLFLAKMRSGMRTLSSKEKILPHTPSPKEQRAHTVCEQLFAGRFPLSAHLINRAIDFPTPPFLRGEVLFFKKKRTVYFEVSFFSLKRKEPPSNTLKKRNASPASLARNF